MLLLSDSGRVEISGKASSTLRSCAPPRMADSRSVLPSFVDKDGDDILFAIIGGGGGGGPFGAGGGGGGGGAKVFAPGGGGGILDMVPPDGGAGGWRPTAISLLLRTMDARLLIPGCEGPEGGPEGGPGGWPGG